MDYTAARHTMVESQIRPNRVTAPRVIAAMEAVPREAFLPKPSQGIAYVDEDIPLGGGRHLIEPLVLARMLQAAEVDTGDVVLDIGCATGYSSAVLARLANTVVALEFDPDLAATATAVLGDLGIDTVAVVEGSLEDGYARQGPYDAIFFSGAVAEIPDAICDQLAEGGRLVAIVSQGVIGKGIRIARRGDMLLRRELFDAATPLLPGFAPKPRFVF